MRSPTLSRLYIQCAPDENLNEWPDERIWDELRRRLGGDAAAALRSAPALEKSVTPMRSFVAQPMRFGRLFLAGDAAHRAADRRQGPESGGRGRPCAGARAHGILRLGPRDPARGVLRHLSRRVWTAQRFSWWMTSMLHRFPGRNPFDDQVQLAELDYVTSSTPHRPRSPRTTSACRSTESARSAHRGADQCLMEAVSRLAALGHPGPRGQNGRSTYARCRDRASSFLLSALERGRFAPVFLIIGSSPTSKHPCRRESMTADRRQIHGVQDSRGNSQAGQTSAWNRHS